MNFLYLDIETAFFERPALLPLPHSTLKEIKHNLKSGNLEKVITHHFGDKRSQFTISSHFH